MLDEILGSLPPSVDWNEFSDSIADAASGLTADTTTTADLPHILNQIFSETYFFEFQGMDNRSDVEFLIVELWMDRQSFFTLCSRGLLPGCALLLLAAWKWLPTESQHRFCGNCLLLQDLCYRLYLVGSNQDLQVLHHVCVYDIEKVANRDRFWMCFVSTEDSRELASAYGNFLSASRTDPSIIGVLSVKIVGLVGQFVLEMIIADDAATLQEKLVVNYHNLEFLWLFLEHRGRVSLVDGDKIKRHAMTIFMFTAGNRTYLVKTQEDQVDFARMLVASEIVGLITRVLLTIMDKGYVFPGREEWRTLLGSVIRLGEALDKSISQAPELFDESRIEWAKFLDQLGLEVRLGVPDVNGKAQFLREIVLNMTNWARKRGFLGTNNQPPQSCGYTRCFRPSEQEEPLRVSYMCGRCRATRYCSQGCQQADWKFSDKSRCRFPANRLLREPNGS
ncbi:hypothetical protein FRC08_017886 [Ceratobasidium sp. 394]|nr:hypothetical protein FRC08_017886 [Ceratobasidium sp. 394]